MESLSGICGKKDVGAISIVIDGVKDSKKKKKKKHENIDQFNSMYVVVSVILYARLAKHRRMTPWSIGFLSLEFVPGYGTLKENSSRGPS